jgi:transposase
MRPAFARAAAVIRVDAAWLATAPLDMRAGTDSALARVIAVFGAAHPHHAYLFANRRGNRIKILVHDGQGIWLAARRLHQGKFHWPRANTPNANRMVGSSSPERLPPTLSLDIQQLAALIQGLPWQQLGERSIIRMV